MISSLVRQQCRRQTKTPLNYDNVTVTWTEFSIYLMCCVNEIEIKSYFNVIVTSVLWEQEISLKRSIRISYFASMGWDKLG